MPQFIARNVLHPGGSAHQTDLLRGRDTVEKAFSHLKPHFEPSFLWLENDVKIAKITSKDDLLYILILKDILEIREIAYFKSFHASCQNTQSSRRRIWK